MRKITSSEARDFALNYIDSKDISPFMNLFYCCESEEEKIELLDKLADQGKTRIAEIERFEMVESKSPDLLVYRAVGRGAVTKFANGGWVEKEEDHQLLWVCDKNNKFSFVIEPLGDFAVLTVAEINPELRSQGHFKKLLAALKYFCFEENSYNFLHARAAIPAASLFNLNEKNKIILNATHHYDWRTRPHITRSRKYKPDFQPTKLFDCWARNLHIYPRLAIDPFASEDELMIVNHRLMRNLPKSYIRKLEKSYPKQKNQRHKQ